MPIKDRNNVFTCVATRQRLSSTICCNMQNGSLEYQRMREAVLVIKVNNPREEFAVFATISR
ncbi:hypothetical protein KCP78_05935 [Salmonella enterica subsp. enterica]|nr:hypothetical protein KCP78_05935 [Salmonella enterica subsp. enterica]